MSSSNLTGTKRKSRFEDSSDTTVTGATEANGEPPNKRPAVDLLTAAAKAAEISRELAAKIASTTSALGMAATGSGAVPGFPPVAVVPPAAVSHLSSAVAQAALRAQLAAQEKKLSALTQIRPLLLDSQGREIDEHGNLITAKTVPPVKTLAANNNPLTSVTTASHAQPPKKKENPYLAHRQMAPVSHSTQAHAAVDATTATTATAVAPTVPTAIATTTATVAALETATAVDSVIDARLAINDRKRELRAKRALQFVDPGTFIAAEEAWKAKEERKMVSGYASGRKQLAKQAKAKQEKKQKKMMKKTTEGETANDDDDDGEASDDEDDDDDDEDDEEGDDEEEDDDGIPEYLKDIPCIVPELTMAPIAVTRPPTDSSSSTEAAFTLPPPSQAALEEHCPALEWWDELYLPKATRERRRVVQRLLLGHPNATATAASTAAVDAKKKPSSSTASTAAATDDDGGKAPTLDGDNGDGNGDGDEYAVLHLHHCKTYKYVQHPPPVKALLPEKTTPTLVPTYLTKAERKKLRKATRAERERTKREQQMLGLLPPPEPKFKLSNFMKILGDTAVADPSKVERKVVEQIQKRMLNHAMRNLAATLTPQQRKQKKLQQLQADAQQGLYQAVFRVTDFTCTKYQYKVDVHAQQWLLSGMALLCHLPKASPASEEAMTKDVTDAAAATSAALAAAVVEKEAEELEQYNLVIVEGGAKGLRKFVKLMTKRIQWSWFIPAKATAAAVEEAATEDAAAAGDGAAMMYPPGYLEALQAKAQQEQQAAGVAVAVEEKDVGQMDTGDDANGDEDANGSGSGSDEDSDDDDDDDDDGVGDGQSLDDAASGVGAGAGTGGATASAGGGVGGVAGGVGGGGVGYGYPGGGLVGAPQRRPYAKCEVLWQGLIAKRVFPGFKFHAVSSKDQARKLCDTKAMAPYWDMLLQAEQRDKTSWINRRKEARATAAASEGAAGVAGAAGTAAAAGSVTTAAAASSIGDIFDADFWN